MKNDYYIQNFYRIGFRSGESYLIEIQLASELIDDITRFPRKGYSTGKTKTRENRSAKKNRSTKETSSI